MKTLGLTLLSITSLLCITACTPPLQEAVRTPPKTDFYTDSLGGEEINIVDNAEAFPMVWNGVIDSEDYFELISNLFQQSKIYSNEALKKTALSLIDRYEKNEDLSTQVNFKKTPFFDILVAKAEPQIRSTIIEIETNLPKDMEKLKVMINDLNAMFQWPEKPSIEQSIIWIQSFMSEITLGVPKLHLNSRVESALITQLKKQSSESIDALQTSAKKLRAEKTLTGAITVIEELVSKLEFSMDESTTKLIKSGKSLGKKIDKYKNSEGALEAILEIWLMLDKNGRKEHIKPVSSDLYDFLNDKSDSTVRCIITPGCFSPWQDFLTDFFIKPKLEDYGLGKLRRELNAGTYEYTVQALEEQVSLVLPSLHKQIVDKIAESVEHERQGLNEITADIPAFVGLSLTKWGENNFDKPPARLYSYEKPSVEVKLKSNYPNYLVEVKAAGSPSLSSTNSAVIGSSLAAYSGLLSSGIKDNKTYIRVFVNQLNKVLGFGGIEYKPNSISVGLMRSFESEKEKFNLPLAPNSPLTFVLVDNLSLKSPYTVQHEISTLNIGAKAQSQLLNGLLDLMDYMKDWQKNDFDNFLGERDAGELFSKDGEPVEKIGQKIFPKDQFFCFAFCSCRKFSKEHHERQNTFHSLSRVRAKIMG